MQRIETHSLVPVERTAELPEAHGVVRGDVYIRIEVRPSNARGLLLRDWASMAQASKAQDRIRDNSLLRDHEG